MNHDSDVSNARKAIFDEIDKHDDGDDGKPARISDVVGAAIMKHAADPAKVFEAFGAMFRAGDVYEPRTGYVRRTAGTWNPHEEDDDGGDE